MKCMQMREHITLFLSDDLASEFSVDLQAHLELCDTCQRYQSEMREMMEDVQQLNGVEVPSDLLASIQTKALPELTADPHRHLWSWKSYSLAAVALVLIVLGWLFPKGSEAPALPEPKVAATVVDEQKMMEDLTLASTTLNDEPSLVLKLYTNDPDVVIYWFGN